MNKDLKYTAVKPNNEIEEKVIIALYELAGFKDNAGDLERVGNEVVIGCLLGFWANSRGNMKIITLGQLAWDYGLCPNDDANYLFWTPHELEWRGEHDTTCNGSVLISTRPKQTLQDGEEVKEWTPEVGEECLVVIAGCDESNIIYLGKDSLGKHAINYTINNFIYQADDAKVKFKPLPTPEEVDREEFVDNVSSLIESLDSDIRDKDGEEWGADGIQIAEMLFAKGYRKTK